MPRVTEIFPRDILGTRAIGLLALYWIMNQLHTQNK
jgi:hypothetical protein